jgi:hypothetical protein
MLSWGVYSHDSVLSRFENDKSHHLTESNRLHHSTHAQTIASILSMVTSHHERWKTKQSHKDTSQTQHHIRWKDLYDTHDCRAKQIY